MLINKKALIGAIKAGQKWLRWDDVTYRSTMQRITGKTSSTKCTLEELQKLREYMHEQGFPRKRARQHGRKPNVATADRLFLEKLKPCWLMLVVPGNMQNQFRSACFSKRLSNGWMMSN